MSHLSIVLAWLCASLLLAACSPASEEPAAGAAEAVEGTAKRQFDWRKPAGLPPDQLELLAARVNDETLEIDIRRWIVVQIATSEQPVATDTLIELLADDDPEIVVTAAEGLRRREGEAARTALESLRDHPNPVVRQRLAELWQ